MSTSLKSILLFLVLLIHYGCKQEEVNPYSGDLRITLLNNAFKYQNYELYTEASYAARKQGLYYLPLKQGGPGQGTIEIKGLHPGTYVVYIYYGDSANITKLLQVTANKVNEYTF